MSRSVHATVLLLQLSSLLAVVGGIWGSKRIIAMEDKFCSIGSFKVLDINADLFAQAFHPRNARTIRLYVARAINVLVTRVLWLLDDMLSSNR